MKRKMIGVLILASMVSGFLGGMIAESMGRPAFSETSNILTADVLQAHEIRLVDSQGQTRGYFGLLTDPTIGSTSVFSLTDSKSRQRVVLSFNRILGPDLSLFDSKGHPRLELAYVPKYGSYLKLANGKSLNPKDSEGLSLWNMNGRTSLFMGDSHGHPRITMGASSQGGSGIALYDSLGKPKTEIGNAFLQDLKTGSTIQTGESSIVIFDKKGHLMWQAPQ